MIDKLSELSRIAKEIEKCRVCKEGKSGRAVPGEGDPDADIVFLGEAPGRTEAKTGRPFVGRSGKFLRSQIAEAGLKDEDVYITSPVKYLPDRGTPTPKDVAHGRIHLMEQLDIINPKIIVLMGSVAALGILGEKIAVTKMHGTTTERDGRTYFFTFHPAAGLRFPKTKEIFKQDFKKLKTFMRR